MSTFDKVIGYETIKNELLKVCDMIHNEQVYKRLGAKIPSGVLLYGEPGLGKTLMAKCFIEECGLKTFTIRKTKSDKFVDYITETFKKAKDEAPSVVFLDDMDKFANEDNNRCDAEEYVAVQAAMDEVKGSNVFVIATVNDVRKFPKSLIRSGRFDIKIEVCCPTENDCMKIIKRYLSDKKVSKQVSMEDFVKMINYSSCAELETILNEAAINAAHLRKEEIEMEDLVKAVLRKQYNAPDDFTGVTDADIKKIALHEAGHIVVSEVLCNGSIGLASLRKTGRDSEGGFVRRCKELPRNFYEVYILLAGKAAVELYYSETCARGSSADINKAFKIIRDDISENGTHGFGMIDVSNWRFNCASENMNSRNEAVVQAELERCMFKTRDILLKNKDFLERTAEALEVKETLLYSDIKKIRESISVTEVAV